MRVLSCPTQIKKPWKLLLWWINKNIRYLNRAKIKKKVWDWGTWRYLNQTFEIWIKKFLFCRFCNSFLTMRNRYALNTTKAYGALSSAGLWTVFMATTSIAWVTFKWIFAVIVPGIVLKAHWVLCSAFLCTIKIILRCKTATAELLLLKYWMTVSLFVRNFV